MCVLFSIGLIRRKRSRNKSQARTFLCNKTRKEETPSIHPSQFFVSLNCCQFAEMTLLLSAFTNLPVFCIAGAENVGLRFRVRYYPADPSILKEEITRYLLFLSFSKEHLSFFACLFQLKHPPSFIDFCPFPACIALN